MVVSEAVEGEPGELGCQLADQAGELNTELLSLQLQTSAGQFGQHVAVYGTDLEDPHDDVGRSGGEIVVDCLRVIYALPDTGHSG